VLIAGGEEFRRLLRQNLGAGTRVVGDAADADQAVALASRLRPDVVLVDVAAARMDGPEVARRIKSAHAETKVVLVTSGDGVGPDLHAADGTADPSVQADALLPREQMVEEMRPRRASRTGARRR
jgi:DNA-binding NarL/FixJ family response regulator